MRGGKSGAVKNLFSGWSSNVDRFVLKWWLDKVLIELDDPGAWEALKTDLYSYAKITINTSSLQNKCVGSIDSLLDVYFDGILPKRSDWGHTENLDLAKKLDIMGKRLVFVKREMTERKMRLPFEVEPKRVQSKICFSPGLAKSSGPTAVNTSSRALQTTPTSSFPNLSKRSTPVAQDFDKKPDSSTSGGKRYKLQFEEILPMEFKSEEEGAESVDVKGLILPKQIFEGKTFYLLQDVNNYVERGLYHYQMYLVKLHGGNVIERRRDLREDTLFIAPDSGELTDTCKNRVVYKPSLIIEHAKMQEYLSKDSMKTHVWRDFKDEASKNVTRFVKQETSNVIDLTLTDDEDPDEKSVEKCKEETLSEMAPKTETEHASSAVVEAPPNETDATQKVANAPQAGVGVRAQEVHASTEGEDAGTKERIPSEEISRAKSDVVSEADAPSEGDVRANDDATAKDEVPADEADISLKGVRFPSTRVEDRDGSTKQILHDDDTENISSMTQNASVTSEGCMDDSNACNKQRVLWSEEKKRHVHSLVFQSCKEGTSAMQICRQAANLFENATGEKIPPETIRTQLKRIEKSGSSKQVFASLKDEFMLTDEMWHAFTNFFVPRDSPFLTSVSDASSKENNGIQGIAAIDKYISDVLK